MKSRFVKMMAGYGVLLVLLNIVSVPCMQPQGGVDPQSAPAAAALASTQMPSDAPVFLRAGAPQSSGDSRLSRSADRQVLSPIHHVQGSNHWQDLLPIESRKYLAATAEEADRVARRIGFLDGRNESASLVCGPLSIAILRDARWLPSDTSVRHIWLLCPRDREGCSGMNTLQKEYFPPARYTYLRVDESVRTYDFRSNPLQPGDWLYLYSSCNGFDHMLVVTRVDGDGVAYSVTNIDRGDGFIIVESPLYDPNHPGKGLFYELTDPARGMLGLSGNGGFLLVRRKSSLSSLPDDRSVGIVR